MYLTLNRRGNVGGEELDALPTCSLLLTRLDCDTVLPSGRARRLI